MMFFPSLVAATMMFGLILCCIVNYKSDDVFPSLVEETIVSWPYFCKSCVAAIMCFPSVVEATMMFGLVLIAGA